MDLHKAYDCIDWDLLRMILIQVGFGIQMTKWIMSCVTSPTYVVLINGETIDLFRSGRGLHQGCPLSLLLFIMVMEGISLLFPSLNPTGQANATVQNNIILILN
jgi:hypothetical protein